MLDSTKLGTLITSAENSFGKIPVMIHDGEQFHEVGRISVLEVKELNSSCLVLRLGDPKTMQSFGIELREDKNEDWMQKHSNEIPPEPPPLVPPLIREGDIGPQGG